ncbi:alpha/beta-hydrolase lipase region domain-containing protein [Phthorimaea operculella]|nr:alpha/beta-hydrolase lipase region domain-containing protein [Phthorimaea operculella]
MAIFCNKIFFVTIICCLHLSSSNIITSGISKGVNAVRNTLGIGSKCILPKALCGDGLRGTFEDILETGPSLKEAIAEMEKTDFLEKYKAGEKNEDKDLTITQLLAKYGYTLQTYTVKTEDGYVITIYRIPGKGEPVLLVHGLINSAIDWFTIGRESALPFLLADRGYDVWLFNARGTIEESQGHARLSLQRDAKLYWDFSWDEIGRYDLPATIDLVLKETGKPKLKYVGFSQGTTSFYVMASERPEYAEKVSLMVSLSPVAWMSKMKSPLIKLISPAGDQFSGVIRNIIGFYKFDDKNPLVQLLTDCICGTSEIATIVCGNLMFSVAGFNYDQVNATQMPVIYGHTPSTASTKQLVHYGQGINTGKFRRYDYGAEKNMAVYGSEVPPDYPVEKISTPVALFYRRESDWFSAYEDVLTLKSKLPNVVDFYEVPHEKWCHTDYVWAKDVKALVYDRLLELFKKY